MADTNYNLLSFGKIPSTQTLAMQMIADGTAADKMAIMAEAQSAGRGRGKSRAWVSHHGNLYISFIYKAREKNPLLSYAFAVGAAETLLAFGIPARIKWPNDLLADGKKISGMLLEYAGGFLVIGYGLNIKTNPTVAEYKTTKTDNYAPGLTPMRVAAALMKNFDIWRAMDFGTVRRRWMELAVADGAPLKYRGKKAEYCGLNSDGALVLRIGGKYELVYGEEVFT